jgi:hypothetical protein
VRTPPERLVFEDGAEVLAHLAERRATGRGWVNVQPAVEMEGSPDGGLLTGRGMPVPLATWMMGSQRRGRVASATLGLQHGTGPRARERLAAEGVAVPDGWIVTQDHPRRGLVVEVPEGVDDATALAWLLRAASALCPVSFDRWVAVVHP